MKPTLNLPNTLLIGLYQGDKAYVAYAKLHKDGFDDVDVIMALGSDGWYVLADTLQALETLNADAVIVLTNDAAIVKALNKPFKAPKPDKNNDKAMNFIERHYMSVPYGGDMRHWDALQALTRYCVKRGFHVDLVKPETIEKTVKFYEDYYRNRNGHASDAYVRLLPRPGVMPTGVPTSSSAATRWFESLDVLDF